MFRFKSWENLTGDQQLAVFFLAAAAIINAVIFAAFGSGKILYYSLISTTAFALLQDRLNRHNFENTAMRFFEDKRLPDLQLLGTTLDGVRWLADHAVGLTAVTNTVFRPSSGPLVFATPDTETAKQVMIAALNTGSCFWRDLYLPGSRPVFDTLVLTDKQQENYEAKELSGDTLQGFPILQVMTLQYRSEGRSSDNRQAVLFGWGYPGGNQTRVFLSHDPETIRYFQTYFDLLYSKGALLTHNDTTPVPCRPSTGNGSTSSSVPTAG